MEISILQFHRPVAYVTIKMRILTCTSSPSRGDWVCFLGSLALVVSLSWHMCMRTCHPPLLYQQNIKQKVKQNHAPKLRHGGVKICFKNTLTLNVANHMYTLTSVVSGGMSIYSLNNKTSQSQMATMRPPNTDLKNKADKDYIYKGK